jgi:hypothetical protein
LSARANINPTIDAEEVGPPELSLGKPEALAAQVAQHYPAVDSSVWPRRLTRPCSLI